MNYNGKANHPVPAKRYTIGIKAFEAKMTEIQRQVALTNEMIAVYDVVRVALEEAKLENDCRLDFDANNVNLTIQVLEDDRRAKFDSLHAVIGTGLVARKYRKTLEGAWRTGSYDFYQIWHLVDFRSKLDRNIPPRVQITYDVPIGGTAYISVITTEKPVTHNYMDKEIKVTWHDEPLREPRVTDLGGPEIEF